jgi:23S rRNA pseudouridine2605 synthase
MEQRLQKIIADAGITSRRKAEQIILEGRVTVNGTPVSKLGSKADLDKDHVRVDGRLLAGTTEHAYLLINKPVGYVSTVKDPEGRPTVISLVKGIRQRVYPVGRLDYHSSGLMILTNDGELANFLMSRTSAIPRTYHVKLEGRPDPDGIAKLQTGIALDGRRTEPCQIRPLGNDEKPWFEVTLIEGRYHQVRRMFERIGKGVVKLKRVGIAFLTDKNLGPGKNRYITHGEVERLKRWKSSDTAALANLKPRTLDRPPAAKVQPAPPKQAEVRRPKTAHARSSHSSPAPGFRPQRKRSSESKSGDRPRPGNRR